MLDLVGVGKSRWRKKMGYLVFLALARIHGCNFLHHSVGHIQRHQLDTNVVKPCIGLFSCFSVCGVSIQLSAACFSIEEKNEEISAPVHVITNSNVCMCTATLLGTMLTDRLDCLG